MKYTCTVDIDLPVNQVAKLWEDENNFREWQDGFLRIEHISGHRGKPGAKSRIYFEQKNRRMELIETILINDLPKIKSGHYEHVHMVNTQVTRFIALDQNKTRLISEVEYTQFNGIIPKLMGWLMPGMFKKQSQKWLDQFKSFAENPHPKIIP